MGLPPWGCKAGSWEECPYNKRQTSLFLAMQAQRRDLLRTRWAGDMGGQEERARCTPNLPAPWSRASQPPELWGNKHLISATHSMVFCYSSRSWLWHTQHVSGFKTRHKLWFFANSATATEVITNNVRFGIRIYLCIYIGVRVFIIWGVERGKNDLHMKQKWHLYVLYLMRRSQDHELLTYIYSSKLY